MLGWLLRTTAIYRCGWQQPAGTCGTELHADYDRTRGTGDWTEASTSTDARLEDLPAETLLSLIHSSFGDIYF